MAFQENKGNRNNETINKIFENAESQEEVHNTNKSFESDTFSEENSGRKSVSLITKPKVEKRKKYSFTIKPSVREKLDKLAKEHNYPSSSRFMEELIERI
ncbi:CopG family transcriptional regulator [Staphylococcus simulans]|uniref:CopG family transcriptional regulator n=1 Tax=Staphylococcus simulans TaxID=1286 RepID=UPI002DBC0A6D|nr:CopG family transcriptional regulator [Staphylococcus simulans]MEB6838057.1 CopG family transcriptional regulator [Staphylococcus simulans]